MDLEELKLAISLENYRISAHAINEAIEDNLEVKTVVKSLNVSESEIIEDYPDGKPLPCCLVLSNTDTFPIHTVWAYDKITKKCILVTVYKPDPAKWVEFKKRR